ncbi:uncharacterized protein N7498_002732 [Penicillium cinerascens]|uniref:Uncharacterized protein n=1 Tax=Penicillium cinerascens TaxID=70096 RepID=A0A9W9NAJ7_9EURO|nr:uncharacterized protein N7498_002732 [Penicillium cinerascens]KAJ5216325.1 hypothetical protein N7498_002732 [Penicillium cinerascens]
MQSKVVAALFFSTLALAAPAPQATSDSTVTDGSGFDLGDAADALSDVPSSILSVLETAIPASWYNDLADPASQSSMIAAMEAGTMPAWYNNLPASVKAWATSADEFGLADVTATADSADSTDSPSGSTGSAAVQTTAASTSSASESASVASVSGSAAMQTTATSTSSASESASVASVSGSAAMQTTATSTSSGSASASSKAASSTSTGGAPIATGSVAMSLAGAVGLLGLAIAL